jgi:glycosyltransferase involved in cell wall biosynthesis
MDTPPNLKTLLFISPVGIIGGGERVLLTLMAAIKTVDPSLELHLLLGSPGPLVAATEALGATVHVLALPDRFLKLGDSGLKQQRWRAYTNLALQVLQGLRELRQYRGQLLTTIKAIQPDLIHSNGIKTHLLMGIIPLENKPIVWHLHDFYSTRPLIAKILRFFSTKATVGIAISKAVAEDSRKVLPALPISVIYNAVDTDRFAPQPSVQNDSATTKSETIKIGLIATFARWKGHDLFLQAAAKVLAQSANPNLRFWIVGGAIYETQGSQFSETELRTLAQSLKIADQVEFLGVQTDVNAMYHPLDIVVHASTQPEPFGMTIIEAMACGKPVIVSQAGGAAELFTHELDALGFQLGNVDALATAMQHLILDTHLRATLAENARQNVVRRFAQPRFGQEVLALYRDLTT